MSYITVAQADELSPDRPLAVEAGGFNVVLVLHDGRIHALEDLCSHGHVPLSEGEVTDGTIECYLHGSTFELTTGRPTCLPAASPVRVFACRVHGDDVQVDLTTGSDD